MCPHALHPGAIQGKEGIKFCHLATLACLEVRALTLKKLKFLFRSNHDELQRLGVTHLLLTGVTTEV